jgi:hypothetical protein
VSAYADNDYGSQLVQLSLGDGQVTVRLRQDAQGLVLEVEDATLLKV